MNHSLILSLVAITSIAGSGFAQDTTALRREISAAPNSAPVIVARFLKSSGSSASRLAGPTAAAAIESLGSTPSARKVSAIVFAAVRVIPDSAIDVVRAAVKVAPNAAPEIAAAAVCAVPNPWKEVLYRRGGSYTRSDRRLASTGGIRPERDFKSSAGDASKDMVDFKDVVDLSKDAPAPEQSMTLAEAIVSAASEPSESLASVQSAVDVALASDPTVLFYAVGGPEGLSGFGDAGSSNYENEPIKIAAPVQPNPPPVSR